MIVYIVMSNERIAYAPNKFLNLPHEEEEMVHYELLQKELETNVLS